MTTLAETAAWLRAVADEVERDPSRWTQGFPRRDACGNPCRRTEDPASWCAAEFAFRDSLPREQRLLAWKALRAAGLIPTQSGPEAWGVPVHNDSLATPAEFVAWFCRAAEWAEKEVRGG